MILTCLRRLDQAQLNIFLAENPRRDAGKYAPGEGILTLIPHVSRVAHIPSVLMLVRVSRHQKKTPARSWR